MIGEAIAQFIYFVIEVARAVGSVANLDVAWGLVVLFSISIIISILDGKTQIRVPKLPKLRKKDEDEEDYEIVLKRRKK